MGRLVLKIQQFIVLYLLLVSREVSSFDTQSVGSRETEHVLELSVPRNRIGIRLLIDQLLVVQIINLEFKGSRNTITVLLQSQELSTLGS